ncbi:RecB family exonuclease [Candidatus Neomarinimicrobiota bacterium]
MTTKATDSVKPAFSFSRLQKFDQCPAAYELRYLKRIQPAGISIESYLGNTVHSTLQWLYETVLAGNLVSFDGMLQHYRDEWVQRWSKSTHINNPGWKTDDYFQLGVRMLAGYYRRFSPFDEPVYRTEFDFTFPLPTDNDILMRVILDRIDRNGEGHWSIHDYKTGKSKLTSVKAARDLQMRIYYLAIKQTFDAAERIDVVWHFLRHGEEQRLDDQQWSTNRLISSLTKKISNIKHAEDAGERFEPREGVLCNWCFYWEHCPAKEGQVHPAKVAH